MPYRISKVNFRGIEFIEGTGETERTGVGLIVWSFDQQFPQIMDNYIFGDEDSLEAARERIRQFILKIMPEDQTKDKVEHGRTVDQSGGRRTS